MSASHTHLLRRDPEINAPRASFLRGWALYLMIGVLAIGSFLSWTSSPTLVAQASLPADLKGEWILVSETGRYHRILVDDRTLLMIPDHAAREVFAATEILVDAGGKTVVLHSNGLSYRLQRLSGRELDLQILDPSTGRGASVGHYALHQRPYGQ